MKKLVSINEASKIYGIGREKLYDMIRTEDDLPVIMVGKHVKINTTLFEEWLDKKTVKRNKL
jgi:excisionase family DNA binding protein